MVLEDENKDPIYFFSFVFWLLRSRRSYFWYFGQKAGLDFKSGSPVALTDGAIDTFEGCATLSNPSGQLLFYSDGITIWNKSHQIMLNGEGLFGNSTTTQSATIVPKPGSSNLFYVFTIDFQGGTNRFSYSIVDMTLDGGLGGVTDQKNIIVYTPTSEKISIVKHANNIDFWVITHGFLGNDFNSYLLTANGLSSTSIISNEGFVADYNSIGYMKISPNGSKLAICYKEAGIAQLFDFNTTTGIVSNGVTILEGTLLVYGAEFSPNSSLLYLSIEDSSVLYQYDLKSPNVALSKISNTYNKFR